MSDSIRPFPLISIRDQVDQKLAALDANAVVIAVSRDRDSARLAVMFKADGGWSFAGWLEHVSGKPVRDITAGFEIRKEFK